MTAAAFPPGTRGWYPSVGACDEFLRLLCYETEYSREQLEALQGKATGQDCGGACDCFRETPNNASSGVLEEGEVITLEVVPLAELWRRTPDGKTIAALHLYEKLLATGALQRIKK